MKTAYPTSRIEDALRHLAEDPDAKVTTAAREFPGSNLSEEETKKAIWAWLTAHNGGRRPFSTALLERVLEAEAKETASPLDAPTKPRRLPANNPPPRALHQEVALRSASAFEADAVAALVALGRSRVWSRKRVAAAVEYMGDTPIADAGELVKVALRLDVSVPAPGQEAGDDGLSPWKARPMGPRAKSLLAVRKGLEDLAAGKGPKILEGQLRKFVGHWTGTVAPAPAKVRRLLEWIDGRAGKPAPAATKPARVERAAPRQAPPAELPAEDPAGWLEIQSGCGGRADYDARYSGSEPKTKRIGFTIRATARLAKLGFEEGKAVRIYWRPKQRQLAIALDAAGKGFKLRSGRETLSIAGAVLPDVLGKEPIEFRQLDPVAGFAVVLGAIGGNQS